MKTLKKLILPTIFLLLLAGMWGYFHGQVTVLLQVNADQDLMLQAHDKQIPYITRYVKLVKEINEAAGDKLAAYEVVEIARIILTSCQVHQDIGLKPSIIMGLIERESGFNPDAVSVSHAYGLMQVIRSTAEMHLPRLGYGAWSRDLALDPIVNIEVGIGELVRLRKLFLEEGLKDWVLPISAFFWGERNTWALLLSKKRANLPSLEYAKGVLDNARAWEEKGV